MTVASNQKCICLIGSMRLICALLVLGLSLLSLSAQAQSGKKTISEIPKIIDQIAPELMEKYQVPGVSVALIGNHELMWLGQYGVTSADDPKPVTRETIFEAASMSKPAFGYVVMRLVESGLLDLDTPLVEYLGEPYIKGEPLHEQITARIALSHQSGYPNWHKGKRQGEKPLTPAFVPGTQFRYSGEGFLFLQRVVEKLTGKNGEELAREYLLDPLKMKQSSYVWQPIYDEIASAGHTSEGKIPEQERRLYHQPNAAYTLYTTPEEYAQFLIEMMRPADEETTLLNGDLRVSMLEPESIAKGRTTIDRNDNNEEGVVFFGLGWRIETTPRGRRYGHGGTNGTGFRCYNEFIPKLGNGIVIMTNATSGKDLWMEIMATVGDALGTSAEPSS